MEQILYTAAAVVLLVVGFQVGRLFTSFSARRRLAAKEQELFTTQKGFKQLYEQEVAGLKAQVAKLTDENKSLAAKTEDYRKKAAGLGGLFNGNSRRAEAMYALLLENESLEEALANQNQKLAVERTDSVKEQTRAARVPARAHEPADERQPSQRCDARDFGRRQPPAGTSRGDAGVAG